MLNKSLKSNFISGLLVFLIALPLCLGISKASGFPPIAGIYTAIIGGLIVTFMSNAPLAIKGPAAGLIAIAVSAVDELGGSDHVLGYKLTLAVIVVSGVIQIIMGLVKTGKLADIFPVSVIHGMLAAIGVIIISKQIHVVLGVVPESKSAFDLLLEIPTSFMKLNPEVAIIGFISLALLFIHPMIKKGFITKLPAPLLVLCFAIPTGFFFDLSIDHDYDIGTLHYHIDPKQLLVALPDSFLSGITMPDWSQITSYTSIKYIIMFSLVGSIESVLSAKAVDSLDPKGRVTNQNQDLIAIGIGNTIAGMIGGLPMISEIVRSSANINNGAKGKMSNFFHGLFLLLFVLLAAPVIKSIPNAALAAMLVFTGFRLAAPNEFKKVSKIGIDQLLQFLITLVVTLITDLLVGVVAGISVKILIELVQGVSFKQMFKLDTQITENNNEVSIKFGGITSFINFLKFKTLIDKQPRDKKITLDFSDAQFVDHTFLHNVHAMQNEFTKNGGTLVKSGFDNHTFVSNHHLATRKQIINPTIAGKSSGSELGKRGEIFRQLAADNKLDFEATMTTSVLRPYLSAFSILSKFKRAENFILGTREHYSFMIFDIVYNKINEFLPSINTATIAIIYNINKGGIPNFYTESQPGIFSLVTNYDFEPVPKSENQDFTVYSDHEELIEGFFTPAITEIVNKGKYNIECLRREVLINDNWEKISGDNLKTFLKYVDDLGTEIVRKRLEEEAAK